MEGALFGRPSEVDPVLLITVIKAGRSLMGFVSGILDMYGTIFPWSRWRILSDSLFDRIPRYRGIYHIALVGEHVQYKRHRSRTIYFGKAKSVYNRLYAHWFGSPAGSRRIQEIIDLGYDLSVRWADSDDPSGDECYLFTEFKERHGELPLANIRGCRGELLLDEL